MSIKVAFIARPNLFIAPGGDTVQMQETAFALKKLNVDVDILIKSEINYSGYDIFHFFNIIDPEDILGHLNKINKPLVVSTIYVNYKEYDSKFRKDAIGIASKFLPYNSVEYLKTLAKFLLKGEKISSLKFFLKGHKQSIKYILNTSSKLLPNSENELKRIKNDFEFSTPYKIIPNGINKNLFKIETEVERDIVLCVGRIEGPKNQLNVIKALKNTKYKVVFIGRKSSNQKKYVDECLSEATDNITFINFLSQAELVNYYNRARVHVLASWFETTGLVNLEAGAMGCNLVLSDRGDVKDYFKDKVVYCQPDNIESIKQAVDEAWNKPISLDLQKYILENYTWERAALLTKQAYEELIKA